ncbi:MAG: hypothetical protein NT106_09390 [Candidatus Sumerlaeota bacterium]|nr:hypothetical protein [Candidatus Sumerlaeota bacterium]
MNPMNEKKLYVWKLADFLSQHDMRMSGKELADHLNRNNFLTSYGSTYKGGKGTYKLISETWHWLHDELGLEDEANKIAEAYVKPDGSYAYQ